MHSPLIVLLDGHTLNPGDLSWAPLEQLGELVQYDRTAAGEIVARAGEADLLLTNKTPLTAATLAQLPRLRYIGVLATGYNVVDVTAARERGIPVTNVPEYGTLAVAQHTLALLLELVNRVGDHAATVRAGRWTNNVDWCYWDYPLAEMAGLNAGIVGTGRIGRAFGKMAEALGMRVQFATRAGGRAELERILAESDVVSLHCPLTPETRDLIRSETLARMKPTALLLNTSRGLLINELDLAKALNEGRLAGAGLDVLSREPPPADNPLLTARNCLITPHLAWAARGARERLLGVAADNIRAFLAGQPVNVVS
jgi:glycerate dehydrogenase